MTSFERMSSLLLSLLPSIPLHKCATCLCRQAGARNDANTKNVRPKKLVMFRTKTCGELRITNVNEEVTLAGWVQTVRKFGAITFIDLRDRYGITQLLFGEELNDLLDANPLGREFVLQATGKVSERSNKNPNISTGDIEITISSFKIL